MSETQDSSHSVGSVFGYHGRRLLLLASGVAAFMLCRWLSNLLHAPEQPGYDPSVLLQGAWLATLLVVALTAVLGAGIGAVLAGRLRQDGPVFTAAIGLTALSIRAGSVDTVIRQAGQSAYGVLFIEMLLLLGLMGAAFLVQSTLLRRGMLLTDVDRKRITDHAHPTRIQLLALATHIVITALLVFTLATSADKFQAMLAVGVGAGLASMATYSFFPLRSSFYFWISPPLVGALGYLMATMTHSQWQIGVPAFPLVVPIPLDYISAGVAGSIAGYWIISKPKPGHVLAVPSNVVSTV